MKQNIRHHIQHDIKTFEIQQMLLNWYDTHARFLPWRDNPTPYRVWISEVMLQQTRVDTVKPYFERFIAELPTIADLADVQEQRLFKLWEGLGYYSRARNLKKAALEIVRNYEGRIPSTAQELIKLPGIGPYSAGAIASIAFGSKAPAIDGNVLRVIARITANRGDITQTETKEGIGEFVQMLLPDFRTGDFNQALMELGATVCLPNGVPRCEDCPVGMLCAANSGNITDQIPVKARKKARRVEQKTVFIIRCDQRTAIEKRPDDGLLQGLWEFPNVEGDLSLKECEAVLRNWGVYASGMEPLRKSKHIFTHVEWHMTGILVYTESCGSGDIQNGTFQEGMFHESMNRKSMLVWATPQELKQHYTIPTAFKAYMETAIR
jgi:A/G-specific adenine glycosylase